MARMRDIRRLEKKIKLLSVEQAQRIIFKNIKPLKFKEKINIENSYKRVLRSNINSKRNQPELDLSSMDGYAVEKLRGPVGAKIEITVVRLGEKDPLIVTIKRAIITVQAVKYRPEENVGYIRLISFSEQANKGVKDAIKNLNKEIGINNLSGFILDLRSNPGGLLDQSAKVTNNFLGSGEIVSDRKSVV